MRSVKCDPISHRGAIIREKVGDIRTINRLLWPAIRTETSEFQSYKCSLRIAKKNADDISMHQYIGVAIVIALLYNFKDQRSSSNLNVTNHSSKAGQKCQN